MKFKFIFVPSLDVFEQIVFWADTYTREFRLMYVVLFDIKFIGRKYCRNA